MVIVKFLQARHTGTFFPTVTRMPGGETSRRFKRRRSEAPSEQVASSLFFQQPRSILDRLRNKQENENTGFRQIADFYLFK